MSEYKTVKIKWADHWIDYGDFTPEQVQECVKAPYVGEFCGHLVGESKQMLAIASNVWEDGTISDVMYIMKRAVVKNEKVDDE